MHQLRTTCGITTPPPTTPKTKPLTPGTSSAQGDRSSSWELPTAPDNKVTGTSPKNQGQLPLKMAIWDTLTISTGDFRRQISETIINQNGKTRKKTMIFPQGGASLETEAQQKCFKKWQVYLPLVDSFSVKLLEKHQKTTTTFGNTLQV